MSKEVALDGGGASPAAGAAAVATSPTGPCAVSTLGASVHFQFYGNEVREVEIEHVIEWTQLIGTVTLSETHRE